jgi:PTS system mannose-specific IIA component
MIGVLVVTHGKFGEALVKSAELIIGEQKEVISLGLELGDDVAQLQKDVEKAINRLEKGKGVIVLTDLFGGSPSNVSASTLNHLDFKLLTGINMPMLLEVLTTREYVEIDELVNSAMAVGMEGIRDLNKLINNKSEVLE